MRWLEGFTSVHVGCTLSADVRTESVTRQDALRLVRDEFAKVGHPVILRMCMTHPAMP